MDAISWVCGFLSHLWFGLKENSSQIQSIVAVVALIIAICAYKNLLAQIKIATHQTRLSIRQTKLSIQQTKESVAQSVEVEKQTKHFADQVKEAAVQTEYAAKQFENSNIQISTLIEHRDLILNIREGELKSEYVKCCVEAIVVLQDAVSLLEVAKNGLAGKVEMFEYEEKMIQVISLNIEQIDKNLNDFAENIKRLICISADLVGGGNVDIKTIQENIYTINLMKLRALRSSYIYPKFNSELNKSININY